MENKKYAVCITMFCVFILTYLVFLGSFPLLDSDETRYADIARNMFNSKDFITLYLDGKIFWDKPPLYFWLENLSFLCFKTVNEFSVRMPTILCALSILTVVFFTVRKAVSTKTAVISTLILMTSVEFVIFSKISLLDMVLAANITIAVCCGFLTYFVREENKKYFWWLFYIFSGFGILSKGIPAVVIPWGTMFFIGLWKKNLREFFKKEYFGIGIILFLLITLPWHIVMYKIHGFEFIREYIIKHHFYRFIGSPEIGRMHSPVYYIPTFLIGFLPWSFMFFFSLPKMAEEKHHDFIIMNLIGLIFGFLFFSLARTKLITYILPLYPFAAIICSRFWTEIRYAKCIQLAVYLTNGIFIAFAVALLFAGLYLPHDLYNMIKPVLVPVALLFLIIAIVGIMALKDKKTMVTFGSYIVLICILSAFAMPKLLNIWFEFGQKDLMIFARYAKTNNLKLAAYNVWERFSLQYYYNGDVQYIQDGNSYGSKYVNTVIFNNTFGNYLVVAKKKDLPKLAESVKYDIVKSGVRYNLIKERCTQKPM